MSFHEMPELIEIKTAPDYAFDSLSSEVTKFQNGLTGEYEVGLAMNGAGGTIHVNSIRLESQLIVFEGVDDQGRTARVIQHYTQLSLQMVAAAKLDEHARRIGF
jgi:hypothetical protein